ncbi:hypothetical protein GH714_030556 [Hevea brasiliensis]|uniref:PLAT domain-containing protein n=1 Tax=Hevea brasiliensis TaxID=3981 RepID=A0A6A6LPC9_HEVBR|nr:hypothetical protein GH714_030556 [Hevea brasiliensis]
MMENNTDGDCKIDNTLIDLNAKPQQINGQNSTNQEQGMDVMSGTNHESASAVPVGSFKREPEMIPLNEKIEDRWEYFVNGIGQGSLIQLIREEIDTGKNVKSSVRGWLPKPSNHVHIVEHAADFTLPCDFGNPGAVLITNLHGKKFYLVEIVIHGLGGGSFFFSANAWIHSQKDNPESRIIFRNQAYLPSQTPPGINDLWHEDLLSIHGYGKGKRKLHGRIYHYTPYNDLCNPDKDEDLARPSLEVVRICLILGAVELAGLQPRQHLLDLCVEFFACLDFVKDGDEAFAEDEEDLYCRFKKNALN